MAIGILSFGAYIPRQRLSRQAILAANAWFNPGLKAQGKGERAMANWDEDSVTMAVEAARDCLAGFDRQSVRGMYLASTSLPFDDRQNSAIMAEALDLAPAIETLDIGASQRGGLSGLLSAFHAAAGLDGPVLLAAAEHRRTRPGSIQEMAYGDGAAALLVGQGQPVARLLGHHSLATDFVDHYRGHGRDFDYAWEERWVRDEGYMKMVPAAIAACLEKAGIGAAAVTRFCMPGTLSRVAQSVGRKAGIADTAVADNLAAVCGDTGAAHALVMLVAALEAAKPGDKILVAGFGQGATALLLEVGEGIASLAPRRGVAGSLARRVPQENYSRFLAFNDLIPLERGMRAELDKATAPTTLYRNRKMILALHAGRCRTCGTIQFPKSLVCVNPNCNARHTQDDHSLADSAGRVLTFTADLLTYSPDPPLYYGMVQFAEGGRMMIDFTDVDADRLDVGSPITMMFRVKDYDQQRGFVRYFWKAAPAA